MIKNVVFDLGRVLYRFWPRDDLINLGYDEAKADELMDCIFDNPLWLDMDRGSYTLPMIVEKYCIDYPHLETDIRRVLDDTWQDRVETIIPASLDFYNAVRTQGFKTYVLSNWSADGFDYIRARDAFLFEKFDGIVVSGYEGIIKPEAGIYQCLLERYGLLPKETLFIDDNIKNIAAAQALGIYGIVFTDISTCKQEFETLVTEGMLVMHRPPC